MVPTPVNLEGNITKHFIPDPLASKKYKRSLKRLMIKLFSSFSSVVLMFQEQGIFLVARYKWEEI